MWPDLQFYAPSSSTVHLTPVRPFFAYGDVEKCTSISVAAGGWLNVHCCSSNQKPIETFRLNVSMGLWFVVRQVDGQRLVIQNNYCLRLPRICPLIDIDGSRQFPLRVAASENICVCFVSWQIRTVVSNLTTNVNNADTGSQRGLSLLWKISPRLYASTSQVVVIHS